MILPVQTSFRNMDPSPAVTTRIEEEVAKLDRYFDRITSCRVMVEAPHRHHRRGEAFHIRIELGVPGKELVVNHAPKIRPELEEVHKNQEIEAPHKDIYVAIQHSFQAMRRQLKDYVRCLRKEIKTHEPLPHARISKLFPKENYGFLQTPDGREIYFHRNSLVNLSYEHLRIGEEVIYSEEAGEKGPQATGVRKAAQHGG